MSRHSENKHLRDEGKQRCWKCRVIKPLVKFAQNKNRASGYSAICDDCRESDKP